MSGDGAEGGDVVKTAPSISEIPAAEWDRLAAPDPAAANPFLKHAFLSALERSGSVGAGTGWTPFHLTVRRGGALIAAAPAYLKDHSYGEYVFDHGWADAYARAGGRYFPKLLCAAPFTPAPGPRLLGADDEARAILARSLIAAAEQLRLSSAHVLFTEEDDALLKAGFLSRLGVQFHWRNRGYRTYDEFLVTLQSRKRKALRRERREAAEGLSFRRVTGAEIRESDWDVFWRFYQDTGSRKWGRPYLTRIFFSMLGEAMRDDILLVFAESGGRAIAGALNLIGGDALYGRYWGRIEERPFLHFEVCYHQAIDFAIERGLSRVEAGAQGEHKLARGYEPTLTRSAHWIADRGFRDAVARYLEAERRQVDAECIALWAETPYHRGEAAQH
ncbi:MAG TPA: GNAT family N-acetyltransferase [Parvularcula sp.]|nr:GNAT family N-acetyltransferase [Parvularcula sp.]HBS31156.1 GNAT family N-acetyltransferase [Parvularcula sp.]HBS36110.1 GNAT family N-acetyltransferase [Parvularcula sp.]